MCPSCDNFLVFCSQGSQISDVTSRELHSQAQERLQHYFMGRALEERAQQHREALMAQISTNIEQLMSMCLFHFCFLKGIPMQDFGDSHNLQKENSIQWSISPFPILRNFYFWIISAHNVFNWCISLNLPDCFPQPFYHSYGPTQTNLLISKMLSPTSQTLLYSKKSFLRLL